MTSLVIPGAAMIRLVWQKGGVDWAINVVGVGNSGAVAINQTLANTLGAAIKGYLTSSGWGGHLVNTVALNRVGIRDLNIANMAEYFDVSAPVVGTAATDPLPFQTAVTITLRTALAGKSYRGRVFLFGVLESDNDASGQMTAATRTAAVAFINGIGSALSSSGLALAVLSRKHSTYQAVTQVVGRDLNWTVQRRRRLAI